MSRKGNCMHIMTTENFFDISEARIFCSNNSAAAGEFDRRKKK